MNVTLIRPGVDLSGPHTRLSQEQGSIFTQGCQNVGRGRGGGRGGVFSYLLLLHCPPLTHTQEYLHESWFGSGTWTQFRQRCSLLVSTLAFVRNSALIALINLCRLMTSPTPTDLFLHRGRTMTNTSWRRHIFTSHLDQSQIQTGVKQLHLPAVVCLSVAAKKGGYLVVIN